MHLKPINRQGKKRRKLKSVPALSCGTSEFGWGDLKKEYLPKMVATQKDTKKDKAAA